MRIAIFGGSFDPPHMAHVMSVAVALSSGEVDRVLAVPCYQHVFGKPLEAFEHRLEMTRAALALFGARAEVSDVERLLGGPSRTLNTLQALGGRHPDWEMRLLIGTDILAEKDSWHRFDEVVRLAPPLIVGRSGYDDDAHTDYQLPAISSTEVRARLADGRPVVHLVPASVVEYIRNHGLYSG